MSSVDSANSQYIKSVSDYEDELKQDYARARRNDEKDVDRMERSYDKAVKKKEKSASEEVDRIREDGRKDYLRDRESDRTELDAIKRRNYDRFGRDRSNEADMYKQKLDEYVSQAETERKTADTRFKDAQKGYQQNYGALAKDLRGQMDRGISDERSSANNTFQEMIAKHKTALDQQREDGKHKLDLLAATRMEEQAASRHDTEALLHDSKRDMDNVEYHANQATEQRLSKDHDANRKRIDDNFAAQQKAHNEESAALHDKIRDLLNAENAYAKEKGQGRRDAIREYEDEWRGRSRRVEEAHEREMNKLKTAIDENDERAARFNDRSLHDRDAYFTGLIANKAAEERDKYTTLSHQYDQTNAQIEQQARKERQHSQDQLEGVAHNAAEERSKALKDQATKYQESSAVQRQLADDSINALQRQLQGKNVVRDDADVSPAVENAVRRSIVKQYEKNFSTEADRNRREVDSLQRNYSDHLQSTALETQDKIARSEAQHQLERHQDRTEFMDHIQDTELNQKESMLRAETDHERQVEVMNQNFGRQATRQRYDNELSVQSLRDDAAAKINAVRQEAEFTLKVQHRASVSHENELIRSYEKKLAQQKDEYDGRMEEIQTSTQQAVRQAQKEGKTNFEEQARSYEQRIAQQEMKFQERERSISRNYEDEIEKIKRSYALSQSKKS